MNKILIILLLSLTLITSNLYSMDEWVASTFIGKKVEMAFVDAEHKIHEIESAVILNVVSGFQLFRSIWNTEYYVVFKVYSSNKIKSKTILLPCYSITHMKEIK